MVVVRFSAPPQIPGLPFQRPQREPLRQIAEDYGPSQGPHWERREGLSGAGWMEPTHLLRRITAGTAEAEPERRRERSAVGVGLQREHKLTHTPPVEARREAQGRQTKHGASSPPPLRALGKRLAESTEAAA